MRYTILRILAVVTALILAVLPIGVDFDNAELVLSQAFCEESDGCMPQNFDDKCPLSSELCTGGSEEEEQT